MESTLNPNDRVLVNKLSYKVHPIHRGDIVVFSRPPAEQVTAVKDLIKRVVAVQGDTVEIVDNHVVLNGRTLNEPYVRGLPTTPLSLFQVCPPAPGQAQSCKVPAHHILVMGDNRTNSSDGRVFGPIDTKLVVGRAFVRIWPLGDISLL
jgi:signal peptidase I